MSYIRYKNLLLWMQWPNVYSWSQADANVDIIGLLAPWSLLVIGHSVIYVDEILCCYNIFFLFLDDS